MASTAILANLPQLLILFNGLLGSATQVAQMIREHPAAGADLKTQLDAFIPGAKAVADQVAAYQPIPKGEVT